MHAAATKYIAIATSFSSQIMAITSPSLSTGVAMLMGLSLLFVAHLQIATGQPDSPKAKADADNIIEGNKKVRCYITS